MKIEEKAIRVIRHMEEISNIQIVGIPCMETEWENS